MHLCLGLQWPSSVMCHCSGPSKRHWTDVRPHQLLQTDQRVWPSSKRGRLRLGMPVLSLAQLTCLLLTCVTQRQAQVKALTQFNKPCDILQD